MCQTRESVDKQRGPTIGILTPYTGGFYYGAILEGIQRVAGARGVAVVAMQTSGMDLFWPDEPGAAYLAMEVVDGWIAVNEFVCPAFTSKIVEKGIPLVYVNARPDEGSCCAVLPDNHSGMKEAVLHLIEHGHRRIAFAGYLGQYDLRERYEGYLAAHHEAGIDIDDSLLFSSCANLEMDGYEIGRCLVRAGVPCTAIVAGTDKIALGVINELKVAGYDVPEQVALVGFDDIEKAQHVDPPLTTVKQSFGLIAALAMETLLSHIEDGKPLPEVVRAPTLFVRRKSCGCQSTYSLPPVEPGIGCSTFEDCLTDALLKVAGSGQLNPVQLEAWPGARAIAELLLQVMNGDSKSVSHDLNGLWMDFLKLNRDAESIDRVIKVLESSVRRWWDDSDSHEGLQITLRDLRVALMRNWRNAEKERNRYYEFVAETNGKINGALANLRSKAALDLSWLRWTHVQYGCLGLWHDATADAPRYLQIVGEYGAEGDPDRLGNARLDAAAFPPRKTCDLLRALGSSNMLTVVPLIGRGPSRGLLAVAAPIEIELLDHVGNVGDWAWHVGASLERAEVEQQLRKHADHDALTGLPNRAVLLAELQALVDSAQEQGFAVILLDLDDFKKINDSMGHQAGDQLLIEIARRLAAAFEGTGTICRLGGDEFAIVVPRVIDEHDVLKKVTTIQQVLRVPFSLSGDPVFTTCSIGVAFSSIQRLGAAEILRDADTAMYRAKLQGRARCEIFHHDMHSQAVERLRLDSRLRLALENNEFALVYQPIISLATGHATGAEALIRWNHPGQGCLSPVRFLAVAEDVGLGIPISEWVIKTACRQAKTWQRDGRFAMPVSVNVSAEHLQTAGFTDFIERTLAEFGLAPQALGIELVESSLIDHRDTTIEVLAHLMDLGVHISIDDFGTGYSSLSYLKDFPISVLKIDRSFVQSLPTDPRDTAIATAVITMGHGLGLEVVAEGVESQAQLDFLQQNGCDMVQGFLLSQPLALEDCRQFLLEDRPRSTEQSPSDRVRAVRTGSDWSALTPAVRH